MSRTIAPYVYTIAAGIRMIESSSTKFDNGVGFSNGWAEFALKNPPPFVPSCLIAIWDATGPTAICWSVTLIVWVRGCPRASSTGFPLASVSGCAYDAGSSSVAVLYAESVCGTPCQASSSATAMDSGIRMYRTPRTVSTQKLPIAVAERRVRPRIRAMRTAIPTAADVKFFTVSPAIWLR